MMTGSHVDITNRDKGRVQGHWRELDVLRGFAAIMMIVNHVGVKFLSPQYTESGFTGTILFIASFAPVVFFFVTGVGAGIQSGQRKKGSRWSNVINKIGILVLADLLMGWGGGKEWQLDFLSFIGLSILVLEFVRNSKSPAISSAVGLAVVSLIRYLVGPIAHKFGYDQQIWGLGLLLGTESTPGISYPLAPWLAYPFLGYLAGVAIDRMRSVIERQRLKIILGLFIAAAVPGIVALYLALKGSIFFRWGTVSLAFYIISFTIIAVCIAISLMICSPHYPQLISSLLTLKGMSSLAIVPIHYFLIDTGFWLGLREIQPTAYYSVAIAILVVSFFLATWMDRAGDAVRKISERGLIRSCLIGLFIASAGIALATSQDNPPTAIISKTVGQLALCLLFVLPSPLPTDLLPTTKA
jgi:uncharacterized membrane protein